MPRRKMPRRQPPLVRPRLRTFTFRIATNPWITEHQQLWHFSIAQRIAESKAVSSKMRQEH